MLRWLSILPLLFVPAACGATATSAPPPPGGAGGVGAAATAAVGASAKATATSTAAAEGPPGESAEAIFVRAQGCWLRTAWPMTPLPTRNERCKALLRALRLPSKHASVEQLILLEERAVAPVVAALQSANAESPTAHTELGRLLSASIRAHRETVNAMLAFQRTFATDLEQSIARKEGWPADLLDDTPWSERGVQVAHALAAISAWRALRDVGTPEARALALLVAEERLALAPALPLRLRPYALAAVLEWYGVAQAPEPVAGTVRIESDRVLRVKLIGAMGRSLPRGKDFDEQLWGSVLLGLVDTLRTTAAGIRQGPFRKACEAEASDFERTFGGHADE